MSLRVVIVTRIPPVLAGFDAVVRALGHEPVALLSMRSADSRYGPPARSGELVMTAAEEMDVLLPARRSAIAPLLAPVDPDLVVCMGFPWKIPPDALAVPRLGWLNGHPSLLPWHRGPRPAAEVHRLAWACLYAMSLGGTRGALLELDGRAVRVLATSPTEVEGASRVECGDGPLWIVETEEFSEEEARQSTAEAPSTP